MDSEQKDPKTLEKVKKLRRKLRDIEELENRRDAGEALDAGQEQKVKAKLDILKELKSLGAPPKPAAKATASDASVLVKNGDTGEVLCGGPIEGAKITTAAELIRIVTENLGEKPGQRFKLLRGEKSREMKAKDGAVTWPSGETAIQCYIEEHYIYRVTRTDKVGADEYVSFVCTAPDDEEARKKHPDNTIEHKYNDVEQQWYKWAPREGAWHKDEEHKWTPKVGSLKVEKLGLAMSSHEGVLLASMKSG